MLNANQCTNRNQSIPSELIPVSPSNRIIVISEPNILQPPPPSISTTTPTPPIRPACSHTHTELLIALRSLVLGVSGQHALYAHADGFDGLHGGPACAAEQVEADDPVGVDVWVDWDGTAGEG